MSKRDKINKITFSVILLLHVLLFSVIVNAQVSGKVYVLTFNYKKQLLTDSLSLVDVKVADGTPTNTLSQPDADYKLDVVSSENNVLKSMNFNIQPGASLLKGVAKDEVQGTPEDLTFKLSIPYYSNAKLINIYDSSNKKLLEIPLESAQVKSLNLNWLYIALPLLLIFGFLTYIEVKRKNDHKMLMQRVQQQSVLTLKNYVTTNLRKGYSKEQIRNALVKNNYSNQDIEEAFKGLR